MVISVQVFSLALIHLVHAPCLWRVGQGEFARDAMRIDREHLPLYQIQTRRKGLGQLDGQFSRHTGSLNQASIDAVLKLEIACRRIPRGAMDRNMAEVVFDGFTKPQANLTRGVGNLRIGCRSSPEQRSVSQQQSWEK
jgi:hypothetical protein